MPRQSTYEQRKLSWKSRVRTRVDRPKTFKNEESAKAYAEKNGLKGYSTVNISTKNNKLKLKIVESA